MQFKNRSDAGRQLAALLAGYRADPSVVVLALPRGGVPVGAEVAAMLVAPLDVFVVRKLGVPGQEELAMGAIASGGIRVLNTSVLEGLRIPGDMVEAITQQEQRELERRERTYRGDRPPLNLQDRTVILVDDGLATGSTMRAAVAAVRQLHPARIVVAVPTAAESTRDDLSRLVDAVVCVITPEPFHAVGLWYEDFTQTSDDEIRPLLERAEGEWSDQHGPGNKERM